MAGATGASSAWVVNIEPKGIYLNYEPHNFRHQPPRVVHTDIGKDAIHTAVKLRLEDLGRWVNVTGFSAVEDWFSPTIIERCGQSHCKAILNMMTIMNINDVSEYANMIEFLFRQYPQELQEIAYSRVEDVFSPEEFTVVPKRYVKGARRHVFNF